MSDKDAVDPHEDDARESTKEGAKNRNNDSLYLLMPQLSR